MGKAVDVQRLRSNIAWAIAHGLDAQDLVPMLEQLLRHSDDASKETQTAKVQLAELVVRHQPWRAALLVRSTLELAPTGRAWAVLALAHTLLKNYRAARTAYRRALVYEPRCASYAHNLGHLLDVVFEDPVRAVPLLKVAYDAVPNEPEIGASYAHALARSNRQDEALQVLRARVGYSDLEARRTLNQWLQVGPSEHAGCETEPARSEARSAAALAPWNESSRGR